MPKDIKNLIEELIGQTVTQETLSIGLRVEPGKDWKYGNQGDYGVGTITGIINGEEEFGLPYNYVTVTWDNDDINNYPLNEASLKYSNGEKKRTLISLFFEEHKLWDVLEITETTDKKLFDGYGKVGAKIQITKVLNKYFEACIFRDGDTPWHVNVDNPTLDKLKFKPIEGYEEKAVNVMSEFADYIETPKFPKEDILKQLQGRFKNPLEFYHIHEKYASYTKGERIMYLTNDCKLVAEKKLVMEKTIFGDTVLERIDNFVFYVPDGNTRGYLEKNHDPEIRHTYKEWVKIFDELTNKTIFNNALKQVILQSNCNETLKTYFKEILVKTDENFIDFDRASKKITYTPKGKDVSFDGRGNVKSVRQEMSPHKFFGKYFKDAPDVSEYDVKCFADEVISNYGEYKMVELEDGQIGKFYTTLKQEGWAVGSCMRQKPLAYFEIYDKNPHVFKMVTIMLNGELVGRCLKVTAKEADTDEEFVFYDRLYYMNEEVVAWFNSYCDTNNLIRKNRNNAESYNCFYNKKRGGTFYCDVYAVIVEDPATGDLEKHYSRMPYLDTMRWGSLGVIYNTDGSIDVKDRLRKIKSARYQFSKENGEYIGRGSYTGYCHAGNTWTDEKIVTITSGKKYLGLTVRESIATKTDDGYTI